MRCDDAEAGAGALSQVLAAMPHNHTPAALRAARRILPFIGSEHAIFLNDLANVIEHETGLCELTEALARAALGYEALAEFDIIPSQYKAEALAKARAFRKVLEKAKGE